MKGLGVALLLLAASLIANAADCEDNQSDCANLANLCEDPTLRDLMHKKCPKTCGECIPGCADAVSDCAELKDECFDSGFRDVMAQNCAKTCGLCSAATECRDTAEDCAQSTNMCNNTLFQDVMAERCTKTCGYCESFVCKDETTNCVELANHCYDADYVDYMQQNCQKTCKYCYAWAHSNKTGYWYKYTPEISGSWTLMESVCIGLGGHLASIHSKAENDFIFNIVKDQWDPFIGLHNNNGVLQWTDGSSIDFSNWKTNDTYSECTQLRAEDGKWANVACEDRSRPAICKKRLHNQ